MGWCYTRVRSAEASSTSLICSWLASLSSPSYWSESTFYSLSRALGNMFWGIESTFYSLSRALGNMFWGIQSTFNPSLDKRATYLEALSQLLTFLFISGKCILRSQLNFKPISSKGNVLWGFEATFFILVLRMSLLIFGQHFSVLTKC